MYTLTPSGATKVLDLNATPTIALYAIVIGDNDNVYLTMGDLDGPSYVTTVKVIPPPTTV